MSLLAISGTITFKLSMEHPSAIYLEIVLIIIWQVVICKCWLY